DVMDHVDVARSRRALAADDQSEGPLRIDEVLSHDALLNIGAGDTHPIKGSIAATGIGSDEVVLSLDLAVAGTRARAEGTLHLPAREGALVTGELSVAGVRPDEFAPLPDLAHTEWRARAMLGGTLGGDLTAAVDGSFEPVAEGAFAGTFTGHARIAP